MAENRDTDLVLAPNEYVFIQDSNTGLIKPLVGPTKKTLDNTEIPAVYDTRTKRFIRTTAREATQLFPIVDERSYLVLENPAAEGQKDHPVKGQDNPMPTLLMGQKKNIPGPATFALWPGQIATVIEGHQLRSNQYLCCVVHNSKEAMANWAKAVVDVTDAAPNSKSDAEKGEVTKQSVTLVTGQVLIIKGTEVSYYIPPTGINVVPDDNGHYTRDAVTLERLEYCILLDESGKKRYVKGPDVVFPKPTEKFIRQESERKFKAIELNNDMGIYVKVIADYDEGKDKHVTGEELFITGKEQKIYYPREEHAIIKYDEQIRHYAVAIPKGEGRYVLNKDNGEINTVVGPAMYLPDPRKEVIVRRILSDREVSLWFPGNTKALEYNRSLRQAAIKTRENFTRVMADSTTRYGAASTSLMDESNVLSNVAFAGDDVQRKTTYTPPRTITLDTKYDGAVNINIWPGYAVQVVSKNGKRRIVIGPESVILHYDETLEIMGLSTGKPKSDDSIYETVYLRVKNNRISDIVEADTKDMVHIQTRVNYRVNFEAKAEQWFSVENYIKFLTQNMRSIIRNEIQKHGIEDVAQNITSIIRDVILGAHTPEKDRTGRFFEENGMKVYDVEILTLIIGDEIIKQKLQNAQHQTVQLALEIAAKKQELTAVREKEDCTKQMDSIISATKIAKAALSEAEALKGRELAKANKDFEKVLEALMAEIEAIRLEVKTNKSNAENEIEKAQLEMRVAAFEKKFKAITPDLISALENSKNTELATVFAEHIPQAGGGIGMVLGHQIIENLLGLVKGTSFEKTLRTLTTDKDQD